MGFVETPAIAVFQPEGVDRDMAVSLAQVASEKRFVTSIFTLPDFTLQRLASGRFCGLMTILTGIYPDQIALQSTQSTLDIINYAQQQEIDVAVLSSRSDTLDIIKPNKSDIVIVSDPSVDASDRFETFEKPLATWLAERALFRGTKNTLF